MKVNVNTLFPILLNSGNSFFSYFEKGPVEADPEYLLIVEANNIAAEVDDEIGVLHKFGKDKYSKRFPELETLVVQPLEYLLTAKELKNRVS